MGMYHSTYVGYGVRIDHLMEDDSYPLSERLEEQLKGTACSYLLAGDYDQDMAFLVIQDDGLDSSEVELGTYQTFSPEAFHSPQYEAWNAQLTQALTVIGITPDADPAWIVVPDLS